MIYEIPFMYYLFTQSPTGLHTGRWQKVTVQYYNCTTLCKLWSRLPPAALSRLGACCIMFIDVVFIYLCNNDVCTAAI